MFVLTVSREPCINPVLFAFSVVADVRVTQRRQFTGGVLGSISSGFGAVNHNVSRLVR